MYSAKAYLILFTCTFADYSLIIPLLNPLALDCQIWKSLIDVASHLDVNDGVINTKCHAKQQLSRLV